MRQWPTRYMFDLDLLTSRGKHSARFCMYVLVPPYWCRRLANDSELVYARSVLYGGCVKMHKRVNAFNLVEREKQEVRLSC